MIGTLANKSFDALVLINQTESTAISILKTLDKKNMLQNLKGKIYGQYICSSESFLKSAGKLSEDMICTDVPSLSGLDKKSTIYINEFKKTHEIKAFESRVAYQQEAIDMIFDAIKAEKYDSTSIRDYIKAINKTHPRKGYLGNVYFDENRDLIGLIPMMEQIKNGKIEILK